MHLTHNTLVPSCHSAYPSLLYAPERSLWHSCNHFLMHDSPCETQKNSATDGSNDEHEQWSLGSFTQDKRENLLLWREGCQGSRIAWVKSDVLGIESWQCHSAVVWYPLIHWWMWMISMSEGAGYADMIKAYSLARQPQPGWRELFTSLGLVFYNGKWK